MAKYRFKIYWESDDENDYVSARSMLKALSELQSKYPRIKKISFSRL